MNCCSPHITREKATDSFFSRHAQRYARRYRRRGPDRVQRIILGGLDTVHYTDSHILDVGCGSGTIHLELLNRGAGRATGVDIAQGMIDQARILAERAGFGDKTSYVHGDFVKCNGEIQNADITVLDKVVCCYDDLDLLLSKAMEKTSSVIVISHPRNVFYVRWGFIIQKIFTNILRFTFQPVWHNWGSIHTTLRMNGYTKIFEDCTFLWHVIIFKKSNKK